MIQDECADLLVRWAKQFERVMELRRAHIFLEAAEIVKRGAEPPAHPPA